MGSKRRQGPRTSESTGMWVLLLVAIGVFVLMLMAGGTQEPIPPVKDQVMEDVKESKYNTIYRVNIAGHEFEIAGNTETGTFGFTKSSDNECFKRFVVIPSRIGIIHVQFNGGVKLPMMAFDNHGKGHCGSLALLLYLCALGIDTKLLNEQTLLTLLREYIESHMDDKAIDDMTYKEYFDSIKRGPWKNVDAIEMCSKKGGGLSHAHYHAFAQVFDVPVREIDMDYNKAMDDPALRGEWGDFSSATYAQLGVAKENGVYKPPGWKGSGFMTCNLLLHKVHPEFTHAVLLGHIISEDPM